MSVSSDAVREVLVFASVDLIGSTALKGEFEPDPNKHRLGKPHWFEKVAGFYQQFADTLKVTQRSVSGPTKSWALVKGIGDELMFQSPIATHEDAYNLTVAFCEALRAFNAKLDGLRVKGALWLAGFPINNTKIPLPAQGSATIDYLGPSIDAGFRIAKYATDFKLMVTVDLALLLTHPRPRTVLEFGFDGKTSLKGVLKDAQYPLIWIVVIQENPEEVAAGYRRSHCNHADLHAYCRRFIESWQNQSWLILPYLNDDPDYQNPVRWHEAIRDDWLLIEEKISLGKGCPDPKIPNGASLDADVVDASLKSETT